MANEELAEVLDQMAFLAELKGENPFKVRALAKAAGIVEALDTPLSRLLESGGVKDVPGIGKGVQAIAAELASTGQVGELEKLRKEFPEKILELREVRGLGPKKIKALHELLGIGSLAELEYACEENRLVTLKGFGEKTQASVLRNIALLKSRQGKAILPVALQEAEGLKEELRSAKGVARVELTGELRRLCEVVSSLDLLAEAEGEALERQGFTERDGAWERGSDQGLRVRVFTASARDFGSRWLETTGPEDFARRHAGKRAATEEEVFAAAKEAFVPPECRDLGRAPRRLVEEGDIRGVFHLHTNWSDGKNTLEEMARAALDLGYEYMGVSDHSQTAFYAHGLDEKRVLQQKKEIEKTQEKLPGIRIFHGIESDILADGSLDYPDAFLRNFDFVIASVHGQMRMSGKEMTKRICAALRNPATTWLGHWTGRLLLGREGYDLDVEEALRCAAAEGKAIELNANPYRLDIDWRLLPRAKELGIGIGIHPDAHSAGGLADTRYGVWMARKGGLSPSDVVNTKPRKEMETWLRERRP